MDYAQERVATLHDLRGTDLAADAPAGEAAVVVPMTEREYANLAAERVLRELERCDPGQVVVPLRAPPERVGAFADWLDSFDLPLSVLWCSGPRLDDLLVDAGVDGERGKGRDVWLGLGLVSERYVVLQDADAATFTASFVRRLLFPLARGYEFSKGYYARVENERLYGRLCRLFYEPLVAALDDAGGGAVVDYLDAFRYALAGECAMTAEFARAARFERRWGLEVGLLGEAFAGPGFGGSAQVDLGRYEHDHRAVSGPTGLSEMSEGVADALLRVVAEHDCVDDYDALRESYRRLANRYVRQYETEAAFNDLRYDASDEREQVDVYAEAVSPPDGDARLPSWEAAPLDPDAVREAAAADLRAARE